MLVVFQTDSSDLRILRRFEEGGTYVRVAFWVDSTIDFPGGIGLRRKRRRRIVWNENGGRGLSKAASPLPWKADYRTELNIVNCYFAMFNYESTYFRSRRSYFYSSSVNFSGITSPHSRNVFKSVIACVASGPRLGCAA